MDKECDFLKEYFNYFDGLFQSKKIVEYPLVYAKYKTIREEYSQSIREVNQNNFLSTMKCILDLDAQLQIMTDLADFDHYQCEYERITEEEILQCSSSDYIFYYLESFGYRLNDKKPHTILHFL